MSGECCECSEHCLECGCKNKSKLKAFKEAGLIGCLTPPIPEALSRRHENGPGPNDKFFYKGKFFQNEEEFWKYAEEYWKYATDQETFFREWDHLGKDIWMNIGLRGTEISNGALNDFLQENFINLLQKFFK